MILIIRVRGGARTAHFIPARVCYGWDRRVSVVVVLVLVLVVLVLVVLVVLAGGSRRVAGAASPWDPMGSHGLPWDPMGSPGTLGARPSATHPPERQRQRRERERKHGDPARAPARRDEISRSGTPLTLIID